MCVQSIECAVGIVKFVYLALQATCVKPHCRSPILGHCDLIEGHSNTALVQPALVNALYQPDQLL